MSINEQIIFQIVDGPNRDRLIDAFKYAYGDDSVKVNFAVSLGYRTIEESGKRIYALARMEDVLVYSIEHENGSGEFFSLNGKCVASLDPLDTTVKPCHFNAHYNTKTRSGEIRFTEHRNK